MRIPSALLKEFIASLSGKAEHHRGCVSTGAEALLGLDFAARWKQRPVDAQQQLTKTALQTNLTHLQSQGHSVSHCARVKSWLGRNRRLSKDYEYRVQT